MGHAITTQLISFLTVKQQADKEGIPYRYLQVLTLACKIYRIADKFGIGGQCFWCIFNLVEVIDRINYQSVIQYLEVCARVNCRSKHVHATMYP